MDAVRSLMRTRSDGWQVMFNRICASTAPGFSTKPNALLVAAAEGRRPGRALDVDMGQGRNSVFLALKGWQVTGFDVSDTGIATARANAKRAGVTIDAVQRSDANFDFGEARWDLIVMTYEPFPVASPAYVERLRRALRPGGLVVVESFASVASAPGCRPVDIDPVELRRAFAAFETVRFEDTTAMADWGTEPTRLVRLVARKPL